MPKFSVCFRDLALRLVYVRYSCKARLQHWFRKWASLGVRRAHRRKRLVLNTALHHGEDAQKQQEQQPLWLKLQSAAVLTLQLGNFKSLGYLSGGGRAGVSDFCTENFKLCPPVCDKLLGE